MGRTPTLKIINYKMCVFMNQKNWLWSFIKKSILSKLIYWFNGIVTNCLLANFVKFGKLNVKLTGNSNGHE